MSNDTGTIFLRAPAHYSGGSISVEGHQYAIEEVVDDPELGTCLLVEIEPAYIDRILVHGFAPCVPPVGRRQRPACFAEPPVIPVSWEPERMDEPTRRIAEQLAVLGFGDAKPPTADDFAMAAAALGIALDPDGKPVPNAPSGAAGAGAPVTAGSPSSAPAAAGADANAAGGDGEPAPKSEAAPADRPARGKGK